MYRKKLFTPSPTFDEGNVQTIPKEDGDAIALIRAPLLSLLSVDPSDSVPVLFRPFSNPCPDLPRHSGPPVKKRTLGVRFPTGAFGSMYRLVKFVTPPQSGGPEDPDMPKRPPPRPLTLWEPEADYVPSNLPIDRKKIIEVDDMLTSWLRDHQRQGVDFMYQCLTGQKSFDGYGVILADDMGLGKTLQSIAVTWTLLKTPHPPLPIAKQKQGIVLPDSTLMKRENCVRRVLIVCPSSLVKNWASEFEKWLLGKCKVTAVAETQKEKVVSAFEGFEYDRESVVLISSYETFRLHAHRLKRVPIDLLICDEAHRLKNDRTKTAVVINAMTTQKRILISGTPIQNDLDEFYALVSITNSKVLGDPVSFRKNYVKPILTGREPNATPSERAKADAALELLSSITNEFIIRRSNALLAKVLPVKLIVNVFCEMSELQRKVYNAICESPSIRKLECTGDGVPGGGAALSAIQTLMKLCSHPSLLRTVKNLGTNFKDAKRLLEEGLASQEPAQAGDENANPRQRRVGASYSAAEKTPKMVMNAALSGKFMFLAEMLRSIRKNTTDRVVVISNYTQTLDLIGAFCHLHRHPCVRLDGGMAVAKRHQLVCKFNDLNNQEAFVFLLSSKAGGCGINLIGANRLIMFDPDWNPANDKQALARIWRDGQKKQCYIYRLFSIGTIEEKIYQRQLRKDGLGAMVVTNDFAEAEVIETLGGEDKENHGLFDVLPTTTLSTTHDCLSCARCQFESDQQTSPPVFPLHGCDQLPRPAFDEDSLNTWAHQYKPFALMEDEVFKNLDFEKVKVPMIMTARIEFIEADVIPVAKVPDAPVMDDKQALPTTTPVASMAKDEVQYSYYSSTGKATKEVLPTSTEANKDDDSYYEYYSDNG